MLDGKRVLEQLSIVYGFISILQHPCEPHYVLLTLECYWLFPHSREHYRNQLYTETVQEGYRSGNVRKIYQQALTDVGIWKQVGDPAWL